ncbi:MAG: hypothetical protein HY704_12355 [Gemmatimonadetes bacterium]|nr:hypothetical protein [Gemmatimonadota bacterium]
MAGRPGRRATAWAAWTVAASAWTGWTVLAPAPLHGQPPENAPAPAAPAGASLLLGAAGESGESAEGALFLLLPVGAQGVAMGRAMTAMPGPESAFWNPAGLATLSEGRFMVFRGEHFAGDATSFSLLFTSELIGALGLSYHLLDIGEQDVTDPQGNVVGALNVRGQVALASFATPLFRRLHAGLNFKVVQFRVSCRGACLDPGVTATTYAVDAGLQSLPFTAFPLRLGAMVAHVGPPLQVINAEQADPLPSRVRVSAAYDVLQHIAPNAPYLVWVAVELEDRWSHPGTPSVYMGSEFTAGTKDAVYVRAGYVLSQTEETDGVAVGFGIHYERFDLALAKSFVGPGLAGEAEPVHVTFGIAF